MKRAYLLVLMALIGSGIYAQPFSATNQVISPTINTTVTNYGRGFDFTPTVDITIDSLGKRVPIMPAQPLTWKIWQVNTQTLIHAQTSLATTPTIYTYEVISAPVTLLAGVRYSLTLYGNFQYYYGPSSQIHPLLTYHTMRYCNGCYAAQPFPTVLLANYHYGNPDFMFSVCPPPPPIPVITGDTTVCEGDTVTYTVPAQTGAVSYNWTVPAGATINSGQGTTSLSVIWNASPGGNICADWTDTCTASVPYCVNVTVNPTTITPTVNDTLICTGNSATLTATAPGPIYDWFDAAAGNLLFTGASYTTPILNATTSYWVQSTINGCVGPLAQVTVGVGQGFIADAGLDIDICIGETANLVVSPNSASNTYNWSEPGIPSIGTLFNQAVTPISTTMYTVQVTDTFGCVGIDSVNVNVTPIPLVAVPANASYCAGDIVPASAYTSVPAGATYNWFHSNLAIGLTPASGTSNTPVFTATNTTLFPDTTIVSIFPTLNSCPGDAVNYLIVVNPTPFANILPSIFTGNPPLTVSFDNGSTINNTYYWDFGNGETSSLFLPPNITYQNTGTYTVALEVTDPITGCLSSDQVTIEVLGELTLIIPTIFTPNGDGINDVFNAVLENSESYSMEIYNRWGKPIFTTNSLEIGWDGTQNGSKLSEGTYFYLIEYSFFEQGILTNEIVKGTVSLFK